MDQLKEVIEALLDVSDIDELDQQEMIEVLACKSQPKRANANILSMDLFFCR